MAREVNPLRTEADAAAAKLELNKRVRRGLWMLAVTLLVAGGIMCYLMATVLHAASMVPEGSDRRDFLARLALICLLTVLWDFVLLVWVAWRIIAYRLRPTRHGPTPYINAWALAGRRFRVQPTGKNKGSMPDILSDEGDLPSTGDFPPNARPPGEKPRRAEDDEDDEDENNRSGWRESP
ncbi:MAG: hypothetical protein FWE88_07085 [Phycisphaerae bacterium]|nr:hypothetical protein [Phycisphaerae bacterium]